MELFGSVRGYQKKLTLVPYEEGEHVMVMYQNGAMDDAWVKGKFLVDRYGRTIGTIEEVLHKRDKERRT